MRIGLRALCVGVLGLATGFAEPSEPEPAEVAARARMLGAKFGGGRRCDPAAFVEVAALRRAHGVQGTVGKAAALAYRGCDDAVAWAELFAARIRDDDTDADRIQLAAAWIAAGRFAQAYAVALPLARAHGPQSQAAWLTGYALFGLDDREGAAPWLLGARGTVEGKKRSDAPVMLALVQQHAGDTDAAVAELRAAIERMPQSASLHAVLAAVQQAGGDEASARDSAAMARRLAEASEREARARARLTNLGASWREALQTGDPGAAGLLDALVEAGPADRVRALISAQVRELQRAGHTDAAGALQQRMRTLPVR
ncbi:MAG: hypothetical protein ACE37F_26230 [Nannocystaceae bacterium]|nr:hypothetical protein [bacterium]